VFIAALITLAFAWPAESMLAQGGGPPQGRSGRTSSTRGESPQQREIEQQLQRRIGAILKERLELTDDQLRQLEAVTVKLERERRAVRGEEWRIRTALRAQLLSGDSASNEVVGELLDRMPRVERRRIELMETEQRELSQFLTPIQRARYMGLQDEIRRNMEEIRERRPGDGKSSSKSDSTRSSSRSSRRGPPGPGAT
jgi:Spy/CpxP family protein refolding chaperone